MRLHAPLTFPTSFTIVAFSNTDTDPRATYTEIKTISVALAIPMTYRGIRLS